MKNLLSLILMMLLGAGSCYAKSEKRIKGLHYQTGKPVMVVMKDGKISEVKEAGALSEKEKQTYIAPGFFDNQVNGFAGVSFSFGGGELTQEGIHQATKALWEFGVTTYLPTLTTNSQEVLEKNFTLLSGAVEDEELLGSVPGFHLEGPYINPEDGFRGAHPKRYVTLPDWEKFMRLYEASGEHILQVTVAPEMEGVQDFIKKCTDKGIVIALGHHNATTDQVNTAVENGAKIATHLGNGCANMINRHRNPLWPQLANDELKISIICDGFHLLPEEIKVFYAAKGVNNTVITSDVTHFAALEPGEYTTHTGEVIELTPEGMLRYPAQNVLYGSASAITRGVGHIMEVTGCSLGDAVQMASTNPAGLYGLDDRGVLEAGKRADVIVFGLENTKLKIQKTFVNGELVYEAE